MADGDHSRPQDQGDKDDVDEDVEFGGVVLPVKDELLLKVKHSHDGVV
jgi:hypothetical protein